MSDKTGVNTMSIFATIKWDTADIASVRPDWDAEKVAAAAPYASRD